MDEITDCGNIDSARVHNTLDVQPQKLIEGDGSNTHIKMAVRPEVMVHQRKWFQ